MNPDIKKTIASINEQLEELGLPKYDIRPEISLFAVINHVGSDIGNEYWGAFESREEAIEAAEKHLYNYSIEADTIRISEDKLRSVLAML